MVQYNNGKVNKLCYECPKGYVDGKLEKQMDEVKEAYKKSSRKDWNTFQKEYWEKKKNV